MTGTVPAGARPATYDLGRTCTRRRSVPDMAQHNRQWVVDHLPVGKLTDDCFVLQRADVPTPGAGEVLVRTVLLSIDPANRAWMQGATYTAPVKAGEVMHGFTLGRVESSNDPAFRAGDIVEANSGWQDFAVHKAKNLEKVDVRGPLELHMGVLGVTGLTAYFGMLDVGRPRAGETVVVSAAAGATGSVAAQVAKIKGCRVVGIAGSPEKCAWLTEDLGLDASVDYRNTESVYRAIKAACPSGIDVY